MKRALLQLILTQVIAMPVFGQAAVTTRPVPNVVGQPVRSALGTLRTAGFTNIEVGYRQTNGVRADTVMVQSPTPPAGARAAFSLPPAYPIVLIAGQQRPKLDTLRITNVDTLRITDTVAVDRLIQDTLFRDRVRVDTVVVNATGGGTTEAGDNCVSPLVVTLATLGGLGLGGLGAGMLLRRPPRIPPGDPRATTQPARDDAAGRDPRDFDVNAFEPVVFDEAVWVTHGTAQAEERAP